jgi:hypothetical protein
MMYSPTRTIYVIIGGLYPNYNVTTIGFAASHLHFASPLHPPQKYKGTTGLLEDPISAVPQQTTPRPS